MKNNLKFKRKSIRLSDFDYAEGNWFYVTLCTYKHTLLFGKITKSKMYLNNFGRIVYKDWNLTKQIRDNVDLDYYVIMPNHFHGILIITHKSKHNLGIDKGAEKFERKDTELPDEMTKDDKGAYRNTPQQMDLNHRPRR